MDDGLMLPVEVLREVGHRAVDVVVDRWASGGASPLGRTASRADLEARLREPLPRQPQDPRVVLERFIEDVLGEILAVNHPRFFGFVPGPSNPIAAVAEFLVAGFNVFAGTWLEASGPAMVELVTIDWLAELLGMPEGSGGVFVGGGSLANLTALVAARQTMLGEDWRRGVLYCSEQTHASVPRAARILGFAPDQLRVIPVDGAFRLDVAALEVAQAEDRAAGRQPFCVVANAGTVNTGAVDPLPELVSVCERDGLWLHVDGAFGGAAVLTTEGHDLLTGIGQATSVTLDPHKWWFQPYECSVLLVRDPRTLRATFHILPEYLEVLERSSDEPNFCDYGLQLTRTFGAAKLWWSLQVFGIEAFAAGVGHGLSLGRAAEALIRAQPGWEIVTPSQLGVVTFRVPGDDAAQEQATAAARSGANAFVGTTRLDGRSVIRLCCINPTTTPADLSATITAMAAKSSDHD